MAQSALIDPEVLFVVPCDDIRQEVNGKFIAVGIYTDAFLPSALPLNFSMSFLAWFRLPKAGVYRVNCLLLVEPNPHPVVKFGFEFEVAEPSERSGVALPAVPLMAGQNGAIVLKMGNEPKEVLRLPIKLAPSPTS